MITAQQLKTRIGVGNFKHIFYSDNNQTVRGRIKELKVFKYGGLNYLEVMFDSISNEGGRVRTFVVKVYADNVQEYNDRGNLLGFTAEPYAKNVEHWGIAKVILSQNPI